MKDYLFTVESISEVSDVIFKLDLVCQNDNIEESLGGQFIHLQVPSKEFLLRRPFCIYSQQGKNISVCFAVKGEGTKSLSQAIVGKKLNGIMPLGNGFNITNKKNIALLGGGMGCAALFNTVYKNPNINFYAYLGFSNIKRDAFTSDFSRLCKQTKVYSYDGSLGTKGYPIDGLVADLNGGAKFDAIFVCGSPSTVRGAQKLLSNFNVPAWVSLEERMGCGVGACLVCTCKVEDNGVKNKRVCKDGPVFNLKDVVL